MIPGLVLWGGGGIKRRLSSPCATSKAGRIQLFICMFLLEYTYTPLGLILLPSNKLDWQTLLRFQSKIVAHVKLIDGLLKRDKPSWVTWRGGGWGSSWVLYPAVARKGPSLSFYLTLWLKNKQTRNKNTIAVECHKHLSCTNCDGGNGGEKGLYFLKKIKWNKLFMKPSFVCAACVFPSSQWARPAVPFLV